MIRTPLQLQFLLHCHCYPEPHEMIHVLAWQDARDFLINNEMIEIHTKATTLSECVFITTAKGKFYIDHLLSVPFPEPVQGWAIPEQQVK